MGTDNFDNDSLFPDLEDDDISPDVVPAAVPRNITIPTISTATSSSPRITAQRSSTSVSSGIHADIGIWGAAKAGKTWYLLAALRELQGLYVERTTEEQEIKSVGYRYRVPESDVTLQKNAQAFLDLLAALETGKPVAATGMGQEFDIQPFSLYITYPDDGTGRVGHFHHLAFTDAAGENIHPDNADSVDAQRYWSELQQTRAILMCFDATRPEALARDPSDHWSIVNHTSLLTSFFSRIDMSNKYLAICIAKVDACKVGKIERFQSYEHYVGSEGANPQVARISLFKEIFGEAAYNKLINYAEGRFSIFPVSALGWLPGDKTEYGIQSAIQQGKWTPYNVTEPLMWLFDQIERDRIRSTRNWLQRKFFGRFQIIDYETERHSNMRQRDEIVRAKHRP